MPRGSKRGKSRPAQGARVVRVPFRYVLYYQTAAAWNVTYVNLRPDLFGARLTAIRDTFNLYRFVSVKATSIFPFVPSQIDADERIDVQHAVAFNQQYLPNNPSYLDTMSEFARFEMSPSTMKAVLRINRSELIGQDPLKWFRCNQEEPDDGTAPADFTSQGYIYWAAYGDALGAMPATRHHIVIEGVCEFCQPKDTGLDLQRVSVPLPRPAFSSSASIAAADTKVDDSQYPDDPVADLPPGAVDMPAHPPGVVPAVFQCPPQQVASAVRDITAKHKAASASMRQLK